MNFKLAGVSEPDCCGLLMAVLYRGEGGSEWFCHAVGQPVKAKSAKDTVPHWQRLLRSTTFHKARAGGVQTRMQVVTIPADASGTMALKSPGGGTLEVSSSSS